MDTFKIDVTGDDLFSKNAGVIIEYSNSGEPFVYAFKFSSDLQSKIRDNFNAKLYCLDNKKILKPRIYCAILVLIFEQILREHAVNTEKYIMNFCRDFDGHEQNIINILNQHFSNKILFEALTADKYYFVKHPKKSLIQRSAEHVYRGEWEGIIKVVLNPNDIHNLIAKPKCRKNKWR
ncbi:MAG: hypothetical protein ACOCP4_04575 [Candidatus Woesearchaeota archaeon]